MFYSYCWVQGGLTATDVFAVEWIQSGAVHFGMTVSYFGFVSDGNLSYLVLIIQATALKFELIFCSLASIFKTVYQCRYLHWNSQDLFGCRKWRWRKLQV